jgi:opacity protein-like surface antigen
MNKLQIGWGLASMLGFMAMAPGHAAAQSALGPYVAVGGGYDSMPDRNLSIGANRVSSQWKNGKGAVLALGYRWSPALRAEVELSGRDAKVTTFNDVAPWAGKQWDNSVMLNAVYDINLGGRIKPYVGAGLGGSWLIWGNNFRVPTQATPTVYDGEGIRPAWQGIVGLSYEVSPKVALALDGRLKGSFGHYSFPGSVAGREITDFKQKTRSIFVSVRYSFGKP